MPGCLVRRAVGGVGESAHKVVSLAGSQAGSGSGELSKAANAASEVFREIAGRSFLRRASESQLMSLNTGN